MSQSSINSLDYPDETHQNRNASTSSHHENASDRLTPVLSAQRPRQYSTTLLPAMVVPLRSQSSTSSEHNVSAVTVRNNPRLTATRIRRMQMELKEMTESPPVNCSAGPTDDDIDHWIATLIGPEDTVYQGGVFFLDVKFPDEYPFLPLKIQFLTRIYHCNINSQGMICLDILKDKWSPALTLAQVLMAITSLLYGCNPLDPLVGAIAKQYADDRNEHDRIARIWTKKYAS